MTYTIEEIIEAMKKICPEIKIKSNAILRVKRIKVVIFVSVYHEIDH